MSYYHLTPSGNAAGHPFFGHLQQMSDFMNGMLFPGLGGGMMQTPLPLQPIMSPALICPFTFPSMEVKFEGLDMTPPGNGHSYTSSTVLRLSNGPDGRPQVYQAHSSTRMAPGGVRETKKSECDTRSGIKKMAIGHHIGERGHIMERQQNFISGEQEQREEYINISEDEAEDFGREFEAKVKSSMVGVQNRMPDLPRIRFAPEEEHVNLDRRNQRLAIMPSTCTSATNAEAVEEEEQRPRKRLHEPEEDLKTKAIKAAPKKKGNSSRRVNKKK